MNYFENYENLKKLMGVKEDYNPKSFSHKIAKESSLFPFKYDTSRPLFEKGFYNILGEFLRVLLDKKMEEDFCTDKVIQDIFKEDIKTDKNNEEYLTKLLNEYMIEKNQLKLLHPYLYLYIDFSSKKHSGGEKELALFLRDVFCYDNENLVKFFKSKKSKHPIIDLILKNVPPLDNYNIERKYYPKLDYVIQSFNDDIEFAMENEKFFLENMDNIFAFYYFFYISQLMLKMSIKINYEEDIDYNESPEELYYLLDWESISKNRKTKDQYTILKDVCYATPPKINLISQLNVLLGTQYKLENELWETFNDLEFDSQKEFLSYLKRWIIDYATVRRFEEIPLIDELTDDYKELVKKLYGYLKDEETGVHWKSRNLFVQNLDDFAKKYFLKRRGQYGYILNINRDMLLMITALCVGEKKIKLDQLFEEYNKRGIFFDYFSKNEVVDFLTKLNLIDKKSDDEDAKYVKPVLRLSLQ